MLAIVIYLARRIGIVRSVNDEINRYRYQLLLYGKAICAAVCDDYTVLARRKRKAMRQIGLRAYYSHGRIVNDVMDTACTLYSDTQRLVQRQSIYRIGISLFDRYSLTHRYFATVR